MGEATGNTSTGMQPNVAGLLCYLLGWVTGLIFFIIEKENKFVRFHAMQSIVVFGCLNVLYILFWIFLFIPYINILFMILLWIVGIAAFILWIILMLKAYQGQMFKLPWAGNFAESKV